MEDSRHPKAKEDANLLNIASTFLGTLIPADGSCKYARFMAQMSANFERIARASIERREKASGSLDYHASTNASPTPVPRHNENSTSPASTHVQQCQDSGYVTSPASNMEMNIPRFESMPHSLASNSLTTSEHNNTDYLHPSQGLPDDITPDYTTTTNTPTTTNTLSQFYNTNLFPTNPTPTQSPYAFSGPSPDSNPCTSTSTGTGTGPCFVPPPPNLWQIPLTADWEFNQFLNSMPPGMGAASNTGTATGTGAGTGYPFDLSTPGLGLAPTPGPGPAAHTQTQTPIDNGDIMGYDYGSQTQTQPQMQNSVQQQHQLYQQFMNAQTPAQVIDNVVWFGGFAGF